MTPADSSPGESAGVIQFLQRLAQAVSEVSVFQGRLQTLTGARAQLLLTGFGLFLCTTQITSDSR